MKKFFSHARFIFILSILVINVVVWYAVFYFESHQNLLVTFFDVGQGDAIFIEVPNGNQILIDGGPGDRILGKLGRAMPFWDRSIDLLVLTHAHSDHVTGVLEVLKRYDIGTILESGEEYSTPEYHEWREVIKQKNIPVVIAHSGQVLHLGQNAELNILSPFENYSGISVKNPHEANVSSQLLYGKTSALLMGDAEKPIEYRLLYENPPKLKSDILKVGHHGSKTSSSEDFLRVVSPKIAVIQVGRKNRYGHPTQEVLDRLASVGAKILRNDLEGDIRLESDGVKYRVRK